jgi:hypothetical protein
MELLFIYGAVMAITLAMGIFTLGVIFAILGWLVE